MNPMMQDIIISIWDICIHNMNDIAIVYQIEVVLVFLFSLFLDGMDKNTVQKYIFIYLLVTNITELLSIIGRSYLDISTNGIIYNFYSVFCISFFYLFYVESFVKQSKYMYICLFCISISYLLFFTSFFKFEYDYKIGIVLSLFYIFSALYWLGYKIINIDNRKITTNPKFWISVGLILWSSFFILRSIPMYLFEKMDEEFQQTLRNIFYLVNIVFYILVFIALLKSKKTIDENEKLTL